jgi:hypothetical protein
MMMQIYHTDRVLILALCLLATGTAGAQNVSSPYSLLGIGDIETKTFSRYSATGAALARRSAFAYNHANPASLTALPYKTIHFDIATRGRISRFKELNVDTFSMPSMDFVMKRITLAFKPTQRTAFAFGLQPYSSVNYLQFQQQAVLDGNNSYTRLIDGSGGLNQVYFSMGRQYGQRFSAGLTASWLFGSLSEETQYIGNTFNLYLLKKQNTFYYGAGLQGGLQYHSLPNKKWQHQVGLTAAAHTRLNGTLEVTYSEGEGNPVITKTVEEDQRFQMPASIGLGYTAVYNNKFTLSAEGQYYNWPYQKVNYTNSYTGSAWRMAAGIEYSKQQKQGNTQTEKYHLGVGFSAESSYLRIKGKQLLDWGFTFGGGMNISRHLSAYSSIELGNRGQRSQGQITESYTQFVVGLALKDLWFGTKRFGRYQ